MRDLLAKNFTDIWVEGEVSNAAPRSPATSTSLSKTTARKSNACASSTERLKFRPEDGLHVTVRGSISVYELRGEYQIYVEQSSR